MKKFLEKVSAWFESRQIAALEVAIERWNSLPVDSEGFKLEGHPCEARNAYGLPVVQNLRIKFDGRTNTVQDLTFGVLSDELAKEFRELCKAEGRDPKTVVFGNSL